MIFNRLRSIRKAMFLAVGVAVVMLASLGVIAGCGGGGEDEEPTPVVDLTPVAVSSPGATEASSTETATICDLGTRSHCAGGDRRRAAMVDLLYRLSQDRLSNPGNHNCSNRTSGDRGFGGHCACCSADGPYTGATDP